MRIGLLVSYIETEWSLSSVPFQKLLTQESCEGGAITRKSAFRSIGRMHGFDHISNRQTIHGIQPILNLPFFVDEPQLCVASTFVRYLNVTKGLKNWCDWLLIAFKRSHRKASTSTITRWIKGMLESSGLSR
nr:unnamed protein product [Callosobruchus analis]